MANQAKGYTSRIVICFHRRARKQEVRFLPETQILRCFQNRLIYVGYGQGALGIINATDGSFVGSIKLTAHPESFQIEQTRSSEGQNNRIFVNVPGSNSIVVVDKQKGITLTTWYIPNAQNNFPMALDEANHRLFVGTRDPARLIVFDTDSGKVVSSLNIAQDADDISYDVA